MVTTRRAAAFGAPHPGAPPLPPDVQRRILIATATACAADASGDAAAIASAAWICCSLRRVCRAWRGWLESEPACYARTARRGQLRALVNAAYEFHLRPRRTSAQSRARAACRRRLAALQSLPFGPPSLTAGLTTAAHNSPAAAAATPQLRTARACVHDRPDAFGLPRTALLIEIDASSLDLTMLGELLQDVAALDAAGAPVLLRIGPLLLSGSSRNDTAVAEAVLSGEGGALGQQPQASGDGQQAAVAHTTAATAAANTSAAGGAAQQQLTWAAVEALWRSLPDIQASVNLERSKSSSSSGGQTLTSGGGNGSGSGTVCWATLIPTANGLTRRQRTESDDEGE